MVPFVQEVLRETRLDAQFLELELTESVVMDNTEEVFARLRE